MKEVSEAQSLVSASKAPALSEEDTAFLLANYPKCLEDVSTEWLSVPVLRPFPPHAPSPHAQGSSGFVATVLLVWRGHTKSTTARSGPGPGLVMWLE